MSAKAGFPSALFLIMLGLSTAQGGNPPAQTGGVGPFGGGGDSSLAQANPPSTELAPAPRESKPIDAPLSGMPEAPLPPAPTEAPPATGGALHTLSDWMLYKRPDCCCPLGANGPIQTELFARTGSALVIGGGILNKALETGWEVQAGGRSLFFNPEMSAAWTVDASLAYFYNQGNTGNMIPIVATTPPPVPPGGALPTITPVQAHLREFHRTNGNIALGREWFYTYHARDYNLGWRFGFDVGGSMGTVRADMRGLALQPHRTDILYGLTTALHTDIEIPRGCCTLVSGFRLEFERDWMDIFQSQNNSNLTSLNFLWNIGVRY